MTFNGNGRATATPRNIEALVRWCYQDELPKDELSADHIGSSLGSWAFQLGIGSVTSFAPQRYGGLGAPHPDSRRIAAAVEALPDATIDWAQEGEAILGELIALCEPRSNGANGAGRSTTRISWAYPRSTREGREERGRRHVEQLEPPRDVLLVRSLRTAALVAMHAQMGTRPRWADDVPRAYSVPAPRGPGVTVIGECKGRNRYSCGSYCPLSWDPSPIAIAEARADYLAWWRGLQTLAQTLELTAFIALPPAAPEMPWRTEETPSTVRPELWPKEHAMLPLRPKRETAGTVTIKRARQSARPGRKRWA